mmetsp:Transcript_20583/g.50524  ORF Transcript_20583/g.50524 Transcript_20583/m.50524 type:complete len:256 (-) Transcript_20583:552-1319(-)
MIWNRPMKPPSLMKVKVLLLKCQQPKMLKTRKEPKINRQSLRRKKVLPKKPLTRSLSKEMPLLLMLSQLLKEKKRRRKNQKSPKNLPLIPKKPLRRPGKWSTKRPLPLHWPLRLPIPRLLSAWATFKPDLPTRSMIKCLSTLRILTRWVTIILWMEPLTVPWIPEATTQWILVITPMMMVLTQEHPEEPTMTPPGTREDQEEPTETTHLAFLELLKMILWQELCKKRNHQGIVATMILKPEIMMPRMKLALVHQE